MAYHLTKIKQFDVVSNEFRSGGRNFLGLFFRGEENGFVPRIFLSCSLKYRAAAICEPITNGYAYADVSYTVARGKRKGGS